MNSVNHFINYRNASIALFIGLLILIGTTFRDYGIAWDEELMVQYGRYLVAQARGAPADPQDQVAVETSNVYLYGGAFDMLAAWATGWLMQVTPFGEMELWHLLNALVGLAGIAGCWLAARTLAGDRAAFWAALLLAATPAFYGQIFFDPKDIPFASGYIWALFFLLGLMRGFPRFNWIYILGFGIVTGLTVGIRMGGAILLLFLGLVLVWNAWQFYREQKTDYSLDDMSHPKNSSGSLWRISLQRVILPVFIATGLVYLTMLLFWPWARQNPIQRPLQALLSEGHFDWNFSVLYRGVYLMADALPIDYIFRYFVIQLPEIFLFVLTVGIIAVLIWFAKGRFRTLYTTFPFAGAVLLFLAAALPVLIALIGHAVLYDGIRHLLFIIPPLACLAGGFIDLLFRWLGNIRQIYITLATLVLAAGVISTVYQAVQLHPYEYIYYNSLVGGLPGAYKDYETEYWSTAFSEATRWLAGALSDAEALSGDRYRVYAACVNDFTVKYYLPEGIKITHDLDNADFLIGGIRWFCNDDLPGKVLHTVSRFGVPLAVVKEP